MYLYREITKEIKDLINYYPVITITGPRQSGKTTLVRNIFPDLPYYSMEDPDIRESILSDPRSFLKKFSDKVIIDEVQRAPELTSYLQRIVDENPKNCRFILTGSQQFEVINTISQSLAGRTAVLKLLPLTINELLPLNLKFTLDDYL
ncbi:MAG: AAA family ATPase [Bacteroidia bacterium]|nr:AAA family ATPase [Bacteroidia bacterium]